MSGHSHWSGIKRKKEITDKKRGTLFSKLLNSVTIAAKKAPNPQFNPTLRSAIEKAKENNVPQDNIEKAVKRASEKADNLEELVMEAYGPEGTAILIEAITDSKNRTVAETKKFLSDHESKWADPGSVLWAFDKNADERGLDADLRGWKPKFKQEISAAAKKKLKALIDELESHDDIQKVTTNTTF